MAQAYDPNYPVCLQVYAPWGDYLGSLGPTVGAAPWCVRGLLYARLMLAFRRILFRQSEGRDDDVFSTLRIDVGSR